MKHQLDPTHRQTANRGALPALADQLDKLLCAKTAAKIIGIAGQTLAAWRSTRRVEIPYVKVGRKVMYRRADLEAYISGNVHGDLPANREAA